MGVSLLPGSEPAVQDPQVQLRILGLHLELWSGGGVLHSAASVQQLRPPHGAHLQGRPGVPLCSAWHRGPHEPAQLLQGGADVAASGPHPAAAPGPAAPARQPGALGRPGELPLRAQPAAQRRPAQLHPLRLLRRPPPADLRGRLPDVQGGRGVAAHPQQIPVGAGDQHSRGARISGHRPQQGEPPQTVFICVADGATKCTTTASCLVYCQHPKEKQASYQICTFLFCFFFWRKGEKWTQLFDFLERIKAVDLQLNKGPPAVLLCAVCSRAFATLARPGCFSLCSVCSTWRRSVKADKEPRPSAPLQRSR